MFNSITSCLSRKIQGAYKEVLKLVKCSKRCITSFMLRPVRAIFCMQLMSLPGRQLIRSFQ